MTPRCGSPLLLLTCAVLMTSSHSEGTTAASDRWRAAYQSEPPLQELLPMFDSLTESGGGAPSAGAAAAAAVAAAADAADAIRALQAVQSRPVLTMMTVLTGEAMERWAAEFPFDLVHVEGSAIIKKVVRQTGNSKCPSKSP